ncbi:MAG: hypothetical protein HGA65_08585 [Oscillochloris sp.]|nr:hypothetical protein [Oscillochloris sp.]
MKDQTRNETIGRLDDLWKVQPQPLGSALPVLGQAKELANSLTRWYVQAIVDQQNAFNASVVQAIQALAANDDHRHTELTLQIHMLNNHLSQLRQSLVVSQRIADQLSKRLDELSRHLSGVDQRLDELSRHLSDVDDAETILAAAVGELRELTAALAAAKEEA